MNKAGKAALHEEILRLLRVPLEEKIEQQRSMAAQYKGVRPTLKSHPRVHEEFIASFREARLEAVEMIKREKYAEAKGKLKRDFERLRDIAATIHPYGDCLETDGAAQWFQAFILPFPHQYPDDEE